MKTKNYAEQGVHPRNFMVLDVIKHEQFMTYGLTEMEEQNKSISKLCDCNCHILNEACDECLVLHGIESLERRDNQNQTVYSQRKRGTFDEIKERRNKIVKIITDYPNTTQEELASTFNVSLSTIQRDMDAMNDDTSRWVDDSARKGIAHKARVSSFRIDNQISRLQYRINHENLDPKTEAFLMEKINQFAATQIGIEGSPVLKKLKKYSDELLDRDPEDPLYLERKENDRKRDMLLLKQNSESSQKHEETNYRHESKRMV